MFNESIKSRAQAKFKNYDKGINPNDMPILY